MSRIRSIKPEFWGKPKLRGTDPWARLLFLGMKNEVDDEGRMLLSPKRLAGVVFPHDDHISAADVMRWMGELEVRGLVKTYEVQGCQYVAVQDFRTDEKIDRPRPSIVPAPPENSASVCGARALDEASTKPRRSLDEASLLDRKGSEGIGREGRGVESAPAPAARALDEPEPMQAEPPAEPVDPAGVKAAMRATVSAMVRTPWQNRGVVGADEQARKPDRGKLIELVASQRDDDGKPRFPALDGRMGRPRLSERVRALYDKWGEHYATAGPDTAWSRLLGWLSADNDRHMQALRAERRADPTVVEQKPRPKPPPDFVYPELSDEERERLKAEGLERAKEKPA